MAEAAGLEIEAFERDARELRVHGSREEWTVAVMDGSDGSWTIPRRADYVALTDLIIAVIEAKQLVADGGADANADDDPALAARPTGPGLPEQS